MKRRYLKSLDELFYGILDQLLNQGILKKDIAEGLQLDPARFSRLVGNRGTRRKAGTPKIDIALVARLVALCKGRMRVVVDLQSGGKKFPLGVTIRT